jgi:virginiamycin B lyase
VRHLASASVGLVVFALSLMALASSASAAPTAITEYPIDVGHPTGIEHLLVAPDGSVWFSDYYWPEGSFDALIGHMSPGGQVQELNPALGSSGEIRGLTAGPDGRIWFTDDAGTIGEVDADGEIVEHGAESDPERAIVGPEGAIWFTAIGGSPAVGRVLADGEVAAYHLPGRPWDAAAGPEGNIWFTYGGGHEEGAIGRVEPKTDGSTVITLFSSGLEAGSEPYEIVAADGYLWFSDTKEGQAAIGRVSPDGQIEEFTAGLAPDSAIWQLALGPEGDVWFADNGAGKVGRVSPSGVITEFTDDSLRPNWGLRYIAAGPDGNMWFTYSGGQAGIGKVTPSGQITMFHENHNGLAINAAPGEIASGPSGELWFLDRIGGTGVDTIGRIVPGDDSIPGPPGGSAASSAGGPAPKPPLGRIAVLGGGELRADRKGRVRVRISCQSTVTPCVGSLQLNLLAKHGALRRRRVASAPFSLMHGASQTLSLKLDRLGRELLAVEHSRHAEISIEAESEVTTESKRLTITSPRQRHQR